MVQKKPGLLFPEVTFHQRSNGCRCCLQVDWSRHSHPFRKRLHSRENILGSSFVACDDSALRKSSGAMCEIMLDHSIFSAYECHAYLNVQRLAKGAFH